MKTLIKALAILMLFSLAWLSCELDADKDKKKIETNDDAEKVAAAKEELTIPAETDCDLELPTELNGVAISWVSSDEAVISSTGLVKQKVYDVEVVLTATLTLGSVTDTKEFTVKVPSHPIIEEDAELVELKFYGNFSGLVPHWIKMVHSDENVVFNCTVDNGQFWTYSSGPLGERKKNISVPSGEQIYWENIEGLLPPPVSKSFDNAFVEIVLELEENIIGYAAVEIDKGHGMYSDADLLKSVLFPMINSEYQNVSEEYIKTAIQKVKDGNTDAIKVAKAKNILLINAEDFDRPTPTFWIRLLTYLHGVAISWLSSNETVITNTGQVTKQLYDTEVTLTATLTLGSVVDTKEFIVTVPARTEE